MSMKRTSSLSDSDRLLALFAWLGLFVFVAVYGHRVLANHTISPEIALAYLTLTPVDSWMEVFKKFLSFQETWYRPFTFYFTNYIIYSFIDFRDIVTIKTLSWIMILVNTTVLVVFARRFLGINMIEAALISALTLSHPTYFYTAAEASGLTDSFFSIFINLFLLSFIPLLQQHRALLVDTAVAISRKHQFMLAAAAVICILLTIMSQERGLCIFFIIGALIIYYYWDQLKDVKNFDISKNLSTVLIVGSSVLMALWYVLFVIKSRLGWTGDVYRANIDFTYIFPNLLKAIELPMRVILFPMQRSEHYYNVHQELIFNLMALPFVIAAMAYVAQVLRKGPAVDKRRLIVLALLIACTLPIPVISGSSPWHFYQASLYMSVIMGRGVYLILTQWVRWVWIRLALVVSMYALLSVSVVRGLEQELGQPGTFSLMEMLLRIDRSLNSEILKNVPYTPEVVYYDTGEYNTNTWSFGGQGNLFKYVYQTPKIVEIAISKGNVIESDRPLCKNIESKRALAFAIDNKTFEWHSIPVKNYCADVN
jgi:hypothetical protein